MTQQFLPATFRLDRSRNASTQVYDFLRERIISLDLKPGTQLQRDELASYFELSSTPIRDALSRLGEEGLLEIVPKQATLVRPIDVASVREAHFMRLSLEVEIVSMLAASPRPAVTATLENMLSRQGLALSQDDFATFTQVDQEFHRHMFVAVNAEVPWQWMRRHSGNLDRLRRLHLPVAGKAAAILADHASIVTAIGRGDPRQAENSLRQHLSGTLAQLDAIRARHPEYFLPDE